MFSKSFPFLLLVVACSDDEGNYVPDWLHPGLSCGARVYLNVEVMIASKIKRMSILIVSTTALLFLSHLLPLSTCIRLQSLSPDILSVLLYLLTEHTLLFLSFNPAVLAKNFCLQPENSFFLHSFFALLARGMHLLRTQQAAAAARRLDLLLLPMQSMAAGKYSNLARLEALFLFLALSIYCLSDRLPREDINAPETGLHAN
jgi:hypothetical protein